MGEESNEKSEVLLISSTAGCGTDGMWGQKIERARSGERADGSSGESGAAGSDQHAGGGLRIFAVPGNRGLRQGVRLYQKDVHRLGHPREAGAVAGSAGNP